MAWYTFSQNNSGGHFVLDKQQGLTNYVLIEGDTMEQILEKAEDIGIYFNGCEMDRDCPCCGDRWSEPWDDELDKEPLIYGTTPEEVIEKGYGWMERGYEIVLHYKNGEMQWM